jgi:hypothetical protein
MLDALPDNSLLKLAKYMPPEERDRFLYNLVTKPVTKPKEGSLTSLLTEPKVDSK